MLTNDLIQNFDLNSQISVSPIIIEVADFPVSSPKFTKSAWDSGEGSGQGEG